MFCFTIAAIILITCLGGCAFTLRSTIRNTMQVAATSTPAECDKIDSQYVGWTATTVVSGVLSGGSGLSSIFTESTPRYVVGGVGVSLAAVTALSTFMGTHYAQKYTRLCVTGVQ